MQYLDVAGHLWKDLVSGEKTNTIRWREAYVQPGRLTFVNCDDRSLTVLVDVRRCTEMPLADAAAFLGKADIWSDEIMLQGMRSHYPDITLTDAVQVVEFTLPPES